MIVCREILKSEASDASVIEHACLKTAWSAEQISTLPDHAVYIAAFSDGRMCGIGSMYCVFGDGQIMNIAVLEDFRRQGVAKEILNTLILSAREKNCESISLEVADNNPAAIRLYEKCGFSAVGRRKGFYGDADAIVMEIRL